MTTQPPVPTRWEESTSTAGYRKHFAQALTDGTDITIEARLAHALVPPGATILDAGCGMGRVGGHLVHLGHQVLGVDLDAHLLAEATRSFPHLPTVQARLEDLTGEQLRQAGHPDRYDLITCVGNVLIVLAPDSEVSVLRTLKHLLAPDGRLLVGFNTAAVVPNSRRYSLDEFTADVTAAGLQVEQHYDSYALRPATPKATFIVAILSVPNPLALTVM